MYFRRYRIQFPNQNQYLEGMNQTKMSNKKNTIETITVILVLVAIIAMSFYHISTKATLGLSLQAWHCIWSFSDTVFTVLMCFLISYLSTGIIKRLFGWPLMLYFIFRGIYYLTIYCNVYVFDIWTWNGIMIAPFIAGLLWILFEEKMPFIIYGMKSFIRQLIHGRD
jgi:hypothetical protein